MRADALARLALLGLLVACGGEDRTADTQAATTPQEPAETRIAMRLVDLHPPEGGVIHMRRLDGVVRAVEGDMPDMRDAKSFRIDVATAELLVGTDAIAGLLTSGKDTPFTSAEVKTTEAGIDVRGTLRSPVPARISFVGPVSVEEGRLVIAPESVEILGVEATGVLDTLDLTLEDVVKARPGLEVAANRLLVDPLANVREPALDAHLVRVEVAEDGLVLFLEGPAPPAESAAEERGISIRGGTVRAGHTILEQADVQLVDVDPSDPLSLDMAALNDQILKGYTKLQPNGGQRVHVPDREDLQGSIAPE